MKKKLTAFLIISWIVSLPSIASAEFVKGGMYAGASAGVSIYDKLDTTDVGYKVYGGYLLYDHIGLDVAYTNMGDPSYGVSVSGMGNLPVNSQISLFAKVGTFVWKYDPPNSKSSSGNDYNIGIGVNFNAQDNIYIHGELERFKIGNDSSIFYSLGLAFDF